MRALTVLAAAWLMSCGLACGAQRGNCFVDLPVYDVRGKRLEIKKVTIRDREGREEMPKKLRDELGFEFRDGRLYFNPKAFGSVLQLQLDIVPEGVVHQLVG